MANAIIENYLGYSRHHCIEALQDDGISSIAFGHWLAVPSKQILLIFRHQQCVGIDYYQLAA